MKCVLCQQEAEHGTSAEIVTGSLKDMAGSRPTYSNFEPISLWFCETCWRVYSAKQEANILYNGLVATGFGAVGLIAVSIANLKDGRMAICGGLALLVLLGGIIYSVYGAMKKANPTDWSTKQLSLEKPKDNFALFKEIVPAIVYELKGNAVDFWTLSNWKEWMKPGSRAKVETFRSRTPGEIMPEEKIKAAQQSIQQDIDKGDFKSALNKCNKYEKSAYFCNQEGKILEKSGREAEAIVAYRRAILYNSGLMEAQENFARLTN